jgi:cell wall-associated NlpC family hydrolase
LKKGIIAATATFAWPQVDIDITRLLALSDAVVRPGNQYEFGGKVALDDTAAEVRADTVDCSGYVRWLLRQASGEGTLTIPDGSVIQHEWVREQGFKRSSVASALLADGALRIAFLAPKPRKAGHVALIRDGMTMESNGGNGPSRRRWTGLNWQASTSVYVLKGPR